MNNDGAVVLPIFSNGNSRVHGVAPSKLIPSIFRTHIVECTCSACNPRAADVTVASAAA